MLLSLLRLLRLRLLSPASLSFSLLCFVCRRVLHRVVELVKRERGNETGKWGRCVSPSSGDGDSDGDVCERFGDENREMLLSSVAPCRRSKR